MTRTKRPAAAAQSQPAGGFSHLDENGAAVMVDVTAKDETAREATAWGEISVGSKIMAAVVLQKIAKGDVLGVARTAGIMAAKKTSDLVPLCHPLFLTSCRVDFELDEAKSVIAVCCRVTTTGRTGVEMEALTGASVALLTIYDMCKALGKGMVLGPIRLLRKSGGRGGVYEAESPPARLEPDCV
ncbi:MAG: cyclic pyranopterin monophosphate synthase MoaC [Deltaproteobacteria bacterium]|nr:cyclic pyranopterin monophosphate synthase MoaC [Deltaproteobacteria bacterium]